MLDFVRLKWILDIKDLSVYLTVEAFSSSKEHVQFEKCLVLEWGQHLYFQNLYSCTV